MVAGDVFVGVPVAPGKAVIRAAPELHKTHAALQQPPGDKTIAAEILSDLLIEPVKLAGRRRFARDIEHLRGAELQARGQLIRGDPRLQTRVALASGLMAPIQLVEQG